MQKENVKHGDQAYGKRILYISFVCTEAFTFALLFRDFWGFWKRGKPISHLLVNDQFRIY